MRKADLGGGRKIPTKFQANGESEVKYFPRV